MTEETQEKGATLDTPVQGFNGADGGQVVTPVTPPVTHLVPPVGAAEAGPDVSIDTPPDGKGEEDTEEKINWRKFRDKQKADREQSEKERVESEGRMRRQREDNERLKAIVAEVSKKDAPVAEQSEDMKELMESLTTGQDVSTILEKVAPQIMEKQFVKWQEQQEAVAVAKRAEDMPKRLREENSDFYDVVTSENLDYLQYHHPEIADLLDKHPNLEEANRKAYKFIKKYVPNADQDNVARVEHNLGGPQALTSAAAPSMTQTGQGSYRISQAQHDANYKRLMERAGLG